MTTIEQVRRGAVSIRILCWRFSWEPQTSRWPPSGRLGTRTLPGASSSSGGQIRPPGVSGPVPVAERLQGGALFAALRKGDVVIAPKLDRLFRSALDALTVDYSVAAASCSNRLASDSLSTV